MPQVPSALSQLKGKNVQSVEEIEANLRQMAGLGGPMSHPQARENLNIPKNHPCVESQREMQQHPQPVGGDGENDEQDMSAFKRFVSIKFYMSLR